MSADKIVYRSAAPAVLQAMREWEARFNAYRDSVKALLAEAGVAGYKIWASTSGWEPGRFRGIDIPAGQQPPKGWRLNQDYAVPDQRYAAGKRFAKALRDIKHPGDPVGTLPGMPSVVLTPGGFATPGLEHDDGAVYVIWGADPERSGHGFTSATAEVDHDLWERIPLSVYYAAKEAREARREVPAA